MHRKYESETITDVDFWEFIQRNIPKIPIFLSQEFIGSYNL